MLSHRMPLLRRSIREMNNAKGNDNANARRNAGFRPIALNPIKKACRERQA